MDGSARFLGVERTKRPSTSQPGETRAGLRHRGRFGKQSRRVWKSGPRPARQSAPGSPHQKANSDSVSPSDPAAQWTVALKGPAFFAYATINCLCAPPRHRGVFRPHAAAARSGLRIWIGVDAELVGRGETDYPLNLRHRQVEAGRRGILA